MRYIVLICAFVLTACAQPYFNPPHNDYFLSVKFYDDFKQIEQPCAKGAAGCVVCNENWTICTVHSIRERCVFDHEIDHVFFGLFHGNQVAGCKVRAK